MATTLVIDPVTRIEGHLGVELEIDNGVVIDAKSIGTQFRGFEIILQGRDPRDAAMLMQRICGVCPIGHATGGINALDDCFQIVPTDAGRIIRNLILGSNLVQSHILHFFHLAALDYVKGPDIPPFAPRYEGDLRLPASINDEAVNTYLEALNQRRLAHEMGAIWAGRMPHTQTIVAGGTTEIATEPKIVDFLMRLEKLQKFIDEKYIPTVKAVAGVYSDYWALGGGCKNYLSYGSYPQKGNLDHMKRENFWKPGIIIQGQKDDFDVANVYENIKYSWYDYHKDSAGETPDKAIISANVKKKDAYSFVKAPRYNGQVMEVGPLARQLVMENPAVVELGDKAHSILGRHFARAVECSQITTAMKDWATSLIAQIGQPTATPYKIPDEAKGAGLTEAPRGALGHWHVIKHGRTAVYNAIVPGTWNMSPRDDNGKLGPLEQSFIGLPIKDPAQPIEAVRLVRSYDPCLACAIHAVTPDKKTLAKFVVS